MKRVLSGVFASVLALSASAVFAQTKPPLKLGGILDMSGNEAFQSLELSRCPLVKK